jgi:hypothetical protein
MRELLKYAFVLAVGAAIGAYTVLSREDDAGRRAQREATAATFEPAPPSTLTLVPAENEHDLSRRPGPLAPYAQSGTAKVERLPLAEKVPGSGDAGASSDMRAASKPTSPVSPPPREVNPPMATVAVSPEASQDNKPADEPTRPAPARAGTDIAAGTQPAALTPDEVCLRDTNRLTQILGRLRVNPSSDEIRRFANELGCEELRPDLKLLIESLDLDPPTPAALPLDTSHTNPLLGQACASERSALDRLRQEPSAEAAGQFWRDMQCEGLRPQVRRLLESLNVTPDPMGSAATPREPKARGVL